jgi:1,4-alpha-glucan branching enzyme
MEAPSAKSVKLAADFTDWEKFPLDMMKSKNGIWFSVIPLAPGQYSYRFIVDGQWYDDPRSTQRVPNPFGSENAVIAVT